MSNSVLGVINFDGFHFTVSKCHYYQSDTAMISVTCRASLEMLCVVKLHFSEKFLEKVYFKSQILVHEYWTVLDYFCILRSSIVSF